MATADAGVGIARRAAMKVVDPYRRCGLAENPFAHGTDDSRDEAGWVDRRWPVAQPEPGGHRLVQVVGVRGAGKTSTLRRWRAGEPGPWHYVPPGARRFRPLPVAPLVYWDEVDRAPAAVRRLGWRTAARRGATVVAGTHLDLAGEARAAGLAVETLALTAISADELTVWAQRRFSTIGAGPEWVLPRRLATEVADQAGASWRVAGDLLHAWVAREVASRVHSTSIGNS